MKIGFVLDDTLDKPDGVQQYVITLSAWLRQQGNEVHYLVGESKRTDIKNIHSLSKNIKVSFNQNRLSIPLPANKKQIKLLLDEEQFDVLHVQLPYSPFLAGRVIRLAPKNTAIVGTFHILPFSVFEKYAAQFLRLWNRRTQKRFSRVFSVSAPAAKFAKKTFKLRSVVIPNLIEMKRFLGAEKLAKYNDGKINIVFLGRLVERKGCMELLKAVAALNEQKALSNVRVLICGKGPLLPDLKKLVKSRHLTFHVDFEGFIKEDDKPNYLATANIAAFPSSGGESFGIVLLEAMASGSEAIIAGDNPGYASVMPSRGQLVDPSDVEKLAKLLKHFILNGKARKSSRYNQMRHVRQFDVGVVGKQIMSEYNLAIAKASKNKHN